MNGVLVVLEYRTQEGVPSWNRLSWEALAAGQELAAGIGQRGAVGGGDGVRATRFGPRECASDVQLVRLPDP